MALVLPSLLLASLVGNVFYRNFGILALKATVDVRVFNVANMTILSETHAFILPVLPGHESVIFPMYSFLIEHKSSQKRLMFDLGIQKDPENTPPAFASVFSSGFAQLEPYRDITVLLQNEGINLTSIDAVVWSHVHFDHVGDMSTFPNSTKLIIGLDTDLATFLESPTAPLQESDFIGHDINRVNFANMTLTVSGLKAVDYFSDRSFYLVDTPGHLLGHLTALACVTPTSFVVLGRDTFHHTRQARPWPQFQKNFPCPTHLLIDSKSTISTDFFWSPGSCIGAFDLPSRAEVLLSVSDLPDSFYADPVKVALFNADPDFFVITAHNISLRSVILYFPVYLNSWKASQLKEKAVWSFIDAVNPAFVFSLIEVAVSHWEPPGGSDSMQCGVATAFGG
ncbi:hypothetical protein DFH08DRAFT_816447 [Mycena albidolilacea]|uniref:Metallo-beta-lactamase domain-containing protein n=1 Tax=Mycena albidolilacea TaxID=1033008 RepID=A0AAD7EJI5_9AGAR|nr:hypothetical protein DFH08DRAFT_816447 [Mycena albidolilacea]